MITGRSNLARLYAADENSASRSAEEELFAAAAVGNLELVLEGVKATPPDVYRDHYGCTALVVAARGGFHRCTSALVEARADPNARDASGGTPLAHAVRKLHPEICRILLKAGATRSAADNHGRIPLHHIPPSVGNVPTEAERTIRGLLSGNRGLPVSEQALLLESADWERRANAAHEKIKQQVKDMRVEQERHNLTIAISMEKQKDAERRRLGRPHEWAPGKPCTRTGASR